MQVGLNLTPSDKFNSLLQHLSPNFVKVAIAEGVNNAANKGYKLIVDATPVDTGALRDSIKVQIATTQDLNARIYSDIDYACVFNAAAIVTTSNGSKRIIDVEIGDMVLTQTGEYQKVIAKRKMSALLKPNMVDIEVPWRNGKNHKLTVTSDHKILAFREGRNKWIEAGDLRLTDLLYVRKKLGKKNENRKIFICINCGKEFSRKQDGAGKYCNQDCRTEHWGSGNSPHIGSVRSNDSREKMRLSAIARFEKNPETHPNILVSAKGFKTSYEKAVATWLDERGILYTEQEKIGKSYVDFCLLIENVIIEADGAFWHRNQAIDIARDKRIKELAPDTVIIHLHFFDKRFSPELDLNPLPGVYYVPCNPGPDTFTDPRYFKTAPIVSLRQWVYGKKTHKKDGLTASVYDLTVENVHSFMANGILISNCYVEYGTGKYNELSSEARMSGYKGRKAVAMFRKNRNAICMLMRQEITKSVKTSLFGD